MQAATADRLQLIKSSSSRAICRREQSATQGDARKVTNTGKESKADCRNANTDNELCSVTEAEKTMLMDAGSNENVETCVLCQVDFEEGESCLACKKCNSGFHICCLNMWLLRTETCP